jgi:hypothetical protein
MHRLSPALRPLEGRGFDRQRPPEVAGGSGDEDGFVGLVPSIEYAPPEYIQSDRVLRRARGRRMGCVATRHSLLPVARVSGDAIPGAASRSAISAFRSGPVLAGMFQRRRAWRRGHAGAREGVAISCSLVRFGRPGAASVHGPPIR